MKRELMPIPEPMMRQIRRLRRDKLLRYLEIIVAAPQGNRRKWF